MESVPDPLEYLNCYSGLWVFFNASRYWMSQRKSKRYDSSVMMVSNRVSSLDYCLPSLNGVCCLIHETASLFWYNPIKLASSSWLTSWQWLQKADETYSIFLCNWRTILFLLRRYKSRFQVSTRSLYGAKVSRPLHRRSVNSRTRKRLSHF